MDPVTEVSLNELRVSGVERTTLISKAYLKDFDWNVKLLMSSDKLASIREPLASIDLDLITENGPKTFSLELDKSELKALIESLEAANKHVLQLRT